MHKWFAYKFLPAAPMLNLNPLRIEIYFIYEENISIEAESEV